MTAFVRANGIRLHYLDTPGAGRPIVLMPGVSANARSFDAITRAGLAPAHRVIALDLRGRGLSDKPAAGYGMADHGADVIAAIEALDLGPVILGGHSFGGLLALWLAARHPAAVTHVLVLDAATEMHPDVRDLIAPSLARLERTYASADEYLAYARALPTLAGAWDEDVARFYRHEIEPLDGRVGLRTSAAAVAQSVDAVLSEPWDAVVPRITQPALLLNATGAFGPPGTPPVLPAEQARRTAERLPRCRYREVPGNHMTMLFGAAGAAVAAAILDFLGSARP